MSYQALLNISPLIQGPLAGISSAPFRSMFWHFGDHLAYTTTEMISVNTILGGPKAIKDRLLNRSSQEKRLCVQLSAHCPSQLYEAVKMIHPLCELVDLNVGCPMKKIRHKYEGSGLLGRPKLLSQLIKAMKDATDKLITVKIRVDGGSNDGFNDPLIEIFNETQPDAVIVHGRHHTDEYSQEPYYDQIKHFKRHLDMPVVGNGDVACFEGLKRMQETGVDGVMIGRAGIGRPWLFAQLQTLLSGQTFTPPDITEQAHLALTHVHSLAQWLGSESLAVLQARRWLKRYHPDQPDALIDESRFMTTITDVEQVVAHYFI